MLFNSLLSLWLSRKGKTPQQHFGTIDTRYNTLLCGGVTGSLAENNSLRFITAKLRLAFDQNTAALLLVNDRQLLHTLQEHYGDGIGIFGVNQSFDPFDACRSGNELLQLLEAAVEADRHKQTSHGSFNGVLSWCQILATIMEMYRYPMRLRSFSELAGMLFTCAGVEDFSRQLGARIGQGSIPAALQQSMNRLWDQSLSAFQFFWNRFFGQLSMVQSERSVGTRGQLVLYLPFDNSDMLKAVLLAKLTLLCRRDGQYLTLLDMNVPLGKSAEVLLTDYSGQVTFGIYTQSLSSIAPCFSALAGNLEQFVCLGVGGGDAQRILQWYNTQRQQWMMSLHPFGLGAGKSMTPQYVAGDFTPQGIRDGGAMVYTRRKGQFKRIRQFMV